jgi:hypothetical protein
VRALQTVTLLTATISTGLIAGVLFAYACSVMPGLARSSDHTLVLRTLAHTAAFGLLAWALVLYGAHSSSNA